MSCGSKRTYSFSSCSNLNLNNSGQLPNSKKKKKIVYKRTTTIVPPTKFLLGGNIRDPLNLNGLQEEDETAVPKKVADDVPLPTLADFLLGGNINDPLNLKGISEQQDVGKAVTEELPSATVTAVPSATTALEKQLSPDDVAENATVMQEDERQLITVSECVNGAKVVGLNLQIAADFRHQRKLDRKDKIVSPVVPQPYRPLKAVPFRQIITPDLGNKVQKTPKFKEKNTRFQYGNYQRYYGYRNVENGVDLRLELLEKHREFFENKDVLDIGCNIGHVSFFIARSFGAKSVLGIDIDRYLIAIAKRNVQYYVNCPSPYSMESPSTAATSSIKKVNLKYKCYPVSMPILYGPVLDNNLKSESHRMFPKNVRFTHGNYVLESESLLQNERPQFDTILCLSVTKWIHLNWGDSGLKLAFKRMFAQLKPGGILILEPQSWDSYKKKKSLTETIWRNYQSIELFPHHFDKYLLSSEVGFSRCQTLGVVNHHHKGFRRAIKVFEKPLSSSCSRKSPCSLDEGKQST